MRKFLKRDQLTSGVWGWISADGPGKMSFVEHLNSLSYTDLLEEMLLPMVKKHYPGQQMVFMQVKSKKVTLCLTINFIFSC